MRSRDVRRLLVGLVMLGVRSAAADPLNLESGLPLEIEDAYPSPFLNRELQTFVRWERTQEGDDLARVVPRLEVGLWYNTEMTVEAPFRFGESVPDGYGDTRVELLYNPNQETRVLPGFAVTGTLIAPTGEGSRGVDGEVELIATKTIPGTWDLHRLHANFAYHFNDDARIGERDDGYEAVVGYEIRATNQLVVLADLVRRQERAKGSETNLGELGMRYRLTPYALMSAGVGVGIGDESPDVRATFGAQAQF